ncbi:MAG: YqgE/AlgH family protein [Deltaproteobacteria bacterium]|nr:YqgE/AlgH family protein [Deltaproteobacteria bacterium]
MSWKKETGTSLKGHFLIAMPSLSDPNFSQTVTCICEHTLEGALGLVINRVLPDLTCGTVFQELGLDSISDRDTKPVYVGGPVHKGQIFVLHGPPFEWEGLHPVTPSLALSNSRDILESLARGKGPETFVLALGCAGWGPGQLEAEIMANAWLTCPVNETILFKTPVEKRWEQSAKSIGIDLSLLSDAVGHA